MMDNKLAKLIKNPRTPCVAHDVNNLKVVQELSLTVISVPHKKVRSFPDPASGPATVGANNNFVTSGISPATNTSGTRIVVLKRFVYQLKCIALPLTTSNAFLITTECMAVMAEDTTPNETPTIDMGMASKKTPMKNPRVTMVHEKSMRSDGRAWRNRYEVPTVKGRTRPRATW